MHWDRAAWAQAARAKPTRPFPNRNGEPPARSAALVPIHPKRPRPLGSGSRATAPTPPRARRRRRAHGKVYRRPTPDFLLASATAIDIWFLFILLYSVCELASTQRFSQEAASNIRHDQLTRGCRLRWRCFGHRLHLLLSKYLNALLSRGWSGCSGLLSAALMSYTFKSARLLGLKRLEELLVVLCPSKLILACA